MHNDEVWISNSSGDLAGDVVKLFFMFFMVTHFAAKMRQLFFEKLRVVLHAANVRNLLASFHSSLEKLLDPRIVLKLNIIRICSSNEKS